MSVRPSTGLARVLRHKETEWEKRLWQRLRNHRCMGLKFRRQHPLGPYVLDFFCAELGLNVEIDGGQHDEPDVRAHDERRTRYLAEHGTWTVRFWNSQVRENLDGVVESIRRVGEEARERLGHHPSPAP